MTYATSLCQRAEALLKPWRGVKGSYALLVEVPLSVHIQTRARRFKLEPGLYAYVGSAKGPGGLASRLLRHVCRRGVAFWHIDFLLKHPDVKVIGWVLLKGGEEKALAKALASEFDGVRGFGNSDDKAPGAHLFRAAGLESLFDLIRSFSPGRATAVLAGDSLEVLSL